MARHTFFSFKYEDDVQRAMTVRKSWVTQGNQTDAGFIDSAEFEKVKKQGNQAVFNWIDKQLENTTVTVVLVDANTNNSKYIQYEIDQSIKRNNGLLEIDISKIKGFDGKTSSRCKWLLPKKYLAYGWNENNGYENLGKWVEKAAKDARK